ncbi:MAG: MBL fold metallo-hydrolase [Actinobacteria bacterium]|nr:MBL fold metallo-hydrolase [Actinomycetota bacterium]
MEAYLCRTCGVQQPPSERPPARCPICLDERQYIGPAGQRWATLAELKEEGHRIELLDEEPGLIGIEVRPRVGIGQRPLLVRTPRGNVLWDCVGYFDADMVDAIANLGGIAAIAFSHPHFYGAAAEWSRAFGDAPIHVPVADRRWFLRTDVEPVLWEGHLELLPGVTLIQCGGHFEGSAALHWAAGSRGKGAILVGDTIAVASDRRFVSFMRSYPNLIPLPREAIESIVESLRPYEFDRIYGGWTGDVVDRGGHEAVERSAERYLRWIGARRP